jgi:antitoxin ParD1/3/4
MIEPIRTTSGLETPPIVAASAGFSDIDASSLPNMPVLPTLAVRNRRSLAISDPADLGDDLEAYVAELVASGRFGSKDDVLREGVRLIQQREGMISALRLKYLQGIAMAERGDPGGAADILAELRSGIAAMKLGRETEN